MNRLSLIRKAVGGLSQSPLQHTPSPRKAETLCHSLIDTVPWNPSQAWLDGIALVATCPLYLGRSRQILRSLLSLYRKQLEHYMCSGDSAGK